MKYVKIALTGFIAITALACEQETALQSAQRKLREGYSVNRLLDHELAALRADNEARCAANAERIRQEESQPATGDLAIYRHMHKEMDDYAMSNDGEFPIEEQDKFFKRFSEQFGRSVQDLESLYLNKPALPAPQQDTPIVTAPEQREKIRLTISEMGIDNHGGLQLRVHNHTTVPLDLINISWFFYDKNGNQIMDGEYPEVVITSRVKDGSDSTVVGAKESKVFCNPLNYAQRSFGSTLDDVGDAEVKIYTRRSAFDALNLETDIECHETTIRQIYQSSRFPLHK